MRVDSRGLLGDCIVGKIADWIESCLAKEPPNRFQTAAPS